MMEVAGRQEPCYPRIKRILMNYKDSAEHTLSGPDYLTGSGGPTAAAVVAGVGGGSSCNGRRPKSPVETKHDVGLRQAAGVDVAQKRGDAASTCSSLPCRNIVKDPTTPAAAAVPLSKGSGGVVGSSGAGSRVNVKVEGVCDGSAYKSGSLSSQKPVGPLVGVKRRSTASTLGPATASGVVRDGRERNAARPSLEEVQSRVDEDVRRSYSRSSGSEKLEVAEVLAAFAMGTIRVSAPKPEAVTQTTELEGEPIACFDVGGEKRLCLPDVLKTVLHHLTPNDISDACDRFGINISECDVEQLASLKRSYVLPESVGRCGLITKTDAERLCSVLLHGGSTARGIAAYRQPIARGDGFKVQHLCFGMCEGVFRVDLYTSPLARCVQCTECGDVLALAQFVSHGHHDLESKTFHWGFDSANWRSYLMLAKDQSGVSVEQLQQMLDELKIKFLDAESCSGQVCIFVTLYFLICNLKFSELVPVLQTCTVSHKLYF